MLELLWCKGELHDGGDSRRQSGEVERREATAPSWKKRRKRGE